MAVVKKKDSKVNEEVKVTEEVKVDAGVEASPEVEVKTEETKTEEPVVETPEVEIEEATEQETDISVDTEEVKTSNKPDGTARIKMRVDHKCCIAMERYDLKAGNTYIVPTNVKNILNKAGLLSPL